LIAAAMMVLSVSGAQAQASRTWVSGVGDDVNPCSRTAPCKTFAGAISKTAAGGQISVLDPGGFGAVTITKAITISTDPALGSTLNPSSFGVTVNAGPNDVVALHGLVIEGAGTGGVTGVRFIAGKALHINNCIIRGQTQGVGVGVDVANAAGTSFVHVTNCDIAKNLIGVRVKPTSPGQARVYLDKVTVDRNTSGAIVAEGAGAAVWLNDSSLTFNGFGIRRLSGGQVTSFGNNALVGNNPDGGPTATTPLR
jgi:hypothetical protein